MADTEKYFTKKVGDQLTVATVAESGSIIPESDRPGDKYTTAMVQTSGGKQLCVKTYDLNGGGGGGGTVDQTYDATSTNAQSGTAVAEAVQPYLKNTATKNTSLTILGTATTQTNNVNIGIGSRAFNGYNVAVGKDSYAYYSSVAIGAICSALDNNTTAIGEAAEARGTKSITIGWNAKTSSSTTTNAIQLGEGTNSTANTFQVYSYTMLDGATGKIPMARLPIVQISQADYDALVSGGTVDANTLYLIV